MGPTALIELATFSLVSLLYFAAITVLLLSSATMSDSQPDAVTVLAEQEAIVQELCTREAAEHGVLLPLKTTIELRDDHTTGQVLITRTPVKCANPAIR